MNRLRAIFGRLQWKLTLSYTLVTSAVVLVLLLALMLVAWTVVFQSDMLGSALSGLLGPLAEELAPLLAEQELDPAAVAAWIDAHYQDRRLILERDRAQTNFGDVTFTGVVDEEGALLAARPGEWAAASPLPLAATTAVSAALADRPASARSVRDEASGSLYVAAPARSEAGRIHGALLIEVELPQTQQALLRSVISGLLPATIPIALGAGFIGTIFGFVAARSLTRRLRALADTADAWSQGDFTAFVQDRSADEIGQLGRRLNLMAEQLQNLLQTRQELAAVEERSRLARELHDAVKQQLFAATMQIGAAQAQLESDPTGARRHLAEAAALANTAQRELGSLIQELRPPALAGRGLAEALQDYAQDWSR
jgi:two-component system, NarL family, sensor histidine kinase LiaS